MRTGGCYDPLYNTVRKIDAARLSATNDFVKILFPICPVIDRRSKISSTDARCRRAFIAKHTLLP